MMAELPNNCIDLTVTSPPYGEQRQYHGYVFDFEAIAKQLWRVTKQGGICVWVIGDETIDGNESLTSFRQALYFQEIGFNLHDTMIYEKLSYPPYTEKHKRYVNVFEFVFILSKGEISTFNPIKDKINKSFGRTVYSGSRRRSDGTTEKHIRDVDIARNGLRSNIWQYSCGNNTGSDNDRHNHPATFPEALARDHIISWSNPGDLVLDPMCGSGTTCKMAKELGRQWLGFDISEEYVKLARRRVGFGRVPLFVM
jgi:site-specific DNA-methyltransferase (adenine-specific)